ncbi:epoxyqueuosine reductase [Dehalobacter sp. DCM]|uniref:4Fe-4S double cluster binding domain-containing protein n=1 Tax=Dehalobacter sp. DCM TaxID=2907827 RepID=UPI003081296E|nr:epoxyqueuosine reductase [Dehalobacter sp. DCM]
MGISKEINNQLIAKGASKIGFADLSCLPREQTNGFNYGIIIGVSLKPEVVLGISDGPTLEYYEEYKRINRLLNELDEYTAEILRNKGFSAYPKTQSNVEIDEKTRRTQLPHKTVATRAGMGWIGKCALLITEEFGSAIRISSVLTDAILDIGIPIEESKCGDCLECKTSCPASAVTGENWNINKDRDAFYNAFDCRKTALEKSSKIGLNETICGLCILKCPWTQKYLRGRRPVVL